MAKLLMAFVMIVIFQFQMAQCQSESCSLSQDTIQRSVMSCMSHEPSLMLQMMEYMDNPNQKEMLDIVCSTPRNQAAIVEMIMCMEKKMDKCMPGGAKNRLLKLLPSKDHMNEGVQFMCKNSQLLTSNCMSTEVTQDFMQCYMGRLQPMITSDYLPSEKMLMNLMCSVLAAEESCLNQYHGTCSKQFVKLVIDLLKKFFPLDSCTNSAMVLKNGQMKTALGSLLLHGSPLRFQPNSKARYNIVQK